MNTKRSKDLIKKMIISEIKSQLNEEATINGAYELEEFIAGAYPWANMNGNTSEQILNGAYELEAAVDELKRSISRYDGFHGRNGLDSNHRNLLQDKREELIDSLNTIQTYFKDIIDLYM